MSCNISILGNVKADAVLREGSNWKVANFSLASNSYDKKTKTKTTKWFNVEVWGFDADFVVKYFKKGSKVFVGGSYINSFYENKEGKKVEKSYVTATVISLAGNPANNGFDHSNQADQEFTTDDIPF